MRIAALDVGGTAIKSGIWSTDGISQMQEWDTNASLGGARLMEHMISILHTYAPFDAIGISTAGQVDTGKGCISYANDNIPGYTGTGVRDILYKEFQVPVAVENDAKAAAIGEMYHGAARGLRDFLCLTYGTGIGGAAVIDGKLLDGAYFAGGCFGRILIHPDKISDWDFCEGSYEKYASTSALVRSVKEVAPELDDGRKIFAAIERPVIRRIIDAWIDEIVYGLVTLIYVFNPADVLLGGGVLAQPYVFREIDRKVHAGITPDARIVRLRQAALGNMAGLAGASVMAELEYNKREAAGRREEAVHLFP